MKTDYMHATFNFISSYGRLNSYYFRIIPIDSHLYIIESISNNTNLIQVCSDGITDSADIITQYVEGIEIKKEQPVEEVPVYNEVTYTYEAVDNSSTQTMTVDEFMALYGQMMEKESE